MLEEISNQTVQAVTQLLHTAKLQRGDIFVLGASSSEILGEKIGTQQYGCSAHGTGCADASFA